MAARKTVKVEELKGLYNDMLENSAMPATDFRLGICAAMDVLLRATGNYRGYTFIPGLGISNNTILDETRRHYS